MTSSDPARDALPPADATATIGATMARHSRPTPRGAARWIVVVALGLAALACTPDPGGGGPTTTTTTLPPSDEPFTVIFVGDSEARMRGNTDAEVAGYVADLASLTTTEVRTFDRDGGIHRVDPSLVILGGDISADRNTSIEADLPLWQPLYDAGIGFVAGFGNHDWDPAFFSDGPGYSVAGHLSNESTKAFTRETYRRTAQLDPTFTYQEVGPSSTHGPVTFAARFRGVGIVNFNTFLYQPSYSYPEGWPLSCNLLQGGAGCQIFASAEPQIAAMESLLPTDPDTPMLFVQHYPLTTGSNWWSDEGASGTTVAQKQQRLLDLMARSRHRLLLAGHNHSPLTVDHAVAGGVAREVIAPYFGGNGGDDPTQGGGFVAVLVSPTEGILEVKTFPNGI